MTSSDEVLQTLSDSIDDVIRIECDRRRLHAYLDGEDGLDHALWRRAAQLGWLAIGLKEELGGLGLGYRGLDVLFRSLGRGVVPGAIGSTLAGVQWLSECAPSAVTTRIIERVLAGELELGIPAVPGAAAMRIEGGRITGESEALLIHSCNSLSILPVSDEGTPGFALVAVGEGCAEQAGNGHARLTRIALWDRTRSIGRIECNAVAPVSVFSDPHGRADDLLRRHLALAIAADCVGGARAIAEQTLEYLKGREQFGRPLASFQALKHRVADLHVAIVEAEQTLDHAVDAATRDTESASMWAALAKADASDAYSFVAADCVQLHGGVGFTWASDCHVFLKRAMLNRQLAGDSGSLRDFAVSRLSQATQAGVTTAELAT